MDTIIKANPLPTLTWNHLAVNVAQFPVHEDGGEKIELPEEFKDFTTSMGDEARDYVLAHATEFAEVRAAANEDAGVESYNYSLSAGERVADVTLISAGAYSKVTVLLNYSSEDEEKADHNGLTLIRAEEGAEVALIQVNLLNDATEHFENVGAVLADNARVHLIQAELGGKSAFAGAYAKLSGYASDFHAETIYFGDKERRIDLNYVAKHLGKKTVSNMDAAGALLDHADKVYRGTLDFVHGCKRAKGHEMEDTLLFSQTAKNRTVPIILCDEDDVNGDHAASIGKINQALLFYLQSRGLSEAQAKQLAVNSKFDPVIAQIPDEDLQEEIREYLDRRMNIDE